MTLIVIIINYNYHRNINPIFNIKLSARNWHETIKCKQWSVAWPLALGITIGLRPNGCIKEIETVPEFSLPFRFHSRGFCSGSHSC